VSEPATVAPTHVSSAHRRKASRHVRRSHAAARRRAAHPRKLGHARKATAAAAGPTLSAMPAHRDDTRYLLAAAALGVLALACLTLQRLLLQVSRLSRGGHAT
jgi:hypothetical protein